MTKEEFENKIKTLERAINNSATPEAQKKEFQALLDKLKSKEHELVKEPETTPTPASAPAKPKGKGGRPRTKEPKKKKEHTDPPAAKPAESKKPAYDCDDLIKEEKERQAKRKLAAQQRSNEPKHTPATKNKIAIEKVAERVTGNVMKRIDKGEVKRTELEKLIKTTEDLLSNLKSALKKL